MNTYDAVFANLPVYLKRMERPMQEAIRTAHDAFGYTPEEFIRDLRADTTGKDGEGYNLPIGQNIDPDADPYTQLDLRSCLKYLCCGGLRITGYTDGEPEFAKDQDTYFLFFNVDMYYTAPSNALWQRRLCAGDHGRALMNLYRMLFVRDAAKEVSVLCPENLPQKLAWMITALQPLSDTQWQYQEECVQLQRELVAARFQAMDAEMTCQEPTAEELYRQGVAYERGYEDPRNICRAVECYQAAAVQGHAPAQAALAKCKLHGIGTSRDRDGALHILRRLTEQGYGPAISGLAECYYYGMGVPRDFAQAEKLYLQAADRGYLDALNTLGFVYMHGMRGEPQPERAYELYRQAAEAGNAEGQCHVGRCLLRGEGVSQDVTQALVWLRKAAEQGHPQAMCDLGRCAAEGTGVAQDMVEAERWFRKAADTGLTLAVGMADAIAIGMLGRDDIPPERLNNAISWMQTLVEEEDALAAGLLERLNAVDA